MNENELKLHRCCFAGCMPEKTTFSESIIKNKIRIEIREAIKSGFTTFITGMAPGVDILAAEIVIEMRQIYKEIKLIAAVPYPGFGKTRDYKRNLQYKKIIERVDLIKEISPKLSDDCLKKRNEWMINHSSRVIVAFNGSDAETKNTMDFANSKSVDVRLIDLKGCG